MGNTFSAVLDNFKQQASVCLSMGSPFYGRLLEEIGGVIVQSSTIGKVLATWPSNPKDAAVALRLVAALHYLVITRQDERLAKIFPPNPELRSEFRESVLIRAFKDHEALILDYLTSPPQTNEVGRSMVLIGGFLEVARRFGPDIDIFEIGASAGLNMAFDQYYYDASAWEWGNDESPVKFKPNWAGSPPSLGPIKVHSRKGCDLLPIDVETQKNRLLSYIWPDQFERFDRIKAAIEHASTVKPVIDKMEATTWLKLQNETASKLRPRVIYHSIIWQYFSEAQQQEFRDAITYIGRSASNDSPVIWLRLEPAKTSKHAELRMTLAGSGSEYVLAESGFHGEWIKWHQTLGR